MQDLIEYKALRFLSADLLIAYIPAKGPVNAYGFGIGSVVLINRPGPNFLRFGIPGHVITARLTARTGRMAP